MFASSLKIITKHYATQNSQNKPVNLWMLIFPTVQSYTASFWHWPQSCFFFATLVGTYNVIRLQNSKGNTIDCLQMELI